MGESIFSFGCPLFFYPIFLRGNNECPLLLMNFRSKLKFVSHFPSSSKPFPGRTSEYPLPLMDFRSKLKFFSKPNVSFSVPWEILSKALLGHSSHFLVLWLEAICKMPLENCSALTLTFRSKMMEEEVALALRTVRSNSSSLQPGKFDSGVQIKTKMNPLSTRVASYLIAWHFK